MEYLGNIFKFFILITVLIVITFTNDSISVNNPSKAVTNTKKTQTVKPKPQKVNTKKPTASKVYIYCDESTYDRKNGFAIAKGKVKIIQNDITIYSDEARYDEKLKISFSPGAAKVVHLDKESHNRITVITGSKMTVWHEEKKILIEKDVRLDREEDKFHIPPDTLAKDKKEKRERTEKAIKKERTVVTADVMEYWSKKKDVFFTGNVVLLQKDKKTTGDKAQILDGPKLIILEGNAKMTQINGDWLVTEKIMEPEKDNKEHERIIKEKMNITADKIVIDQKTSDFTATGNVVITQRVAGNKDRMSKSDQCVFKDAEGTLTLTGNVRIEKENKDWMTATKAILYTDSQNFKAFGGGNKQIESEITADESPTPEPVGSSEPAHDLNSHTPAPVLPDWLKNKK